LVIVFWHLDPYRTAAAGETLSFPSILHAPIIDLLLNGPNAISKIGRPGAGPAIALSSLRPLFSLAGLCYAELASMIPIAGSAYTYSYGDACEDLRLDHRLGPHPRIGRLQHGRSRRLLGLLQ
jgi:hypothetical protein